MTIDKNTSRNNRDLILKHMRMGDVETLPIEKMLPNMTKEDINYIEVHGAKYVEDMQKRSQAYQNMNRS